MAAQSIKPVPYSDKGISLLTNALKKSIDKNPLTDEFKARLEEFANCSIDGKERLVIEAFINYAGKRIANPIFTNINVNVTVIDDATPRKDEVET